MRIFKILFVIFLLTNQMAFSQTSEEVFTKDTMVWFGLDFSMARFVGEFGDITQEGASELRDVFFVSWNRVILDESDKYDLAKFYKKKDVLLDLDPVKEANKEVNPDSIFSTVAPAKLSIQQIQNAVNKYNPRHTSGLGLVYFIETFDKTKERGIMHVTFFDIGTRKILMSRRMASMASGFGLRNYWIRAVHAAMQYCAGNWKTWKKEAAKKK